MRAGSHPGDAELLDVLEGAGGPAVRGHVEACPACRGRLAAARAGQDLARLAATTDAEPEPLYAVLRRSIETSLERQAPPAKQWRPAGWLVAAAVLVGALAVREPPPTRRTEVAVPAWSAPSDEEPDAGLEVIAALVGSGEDLGPWTECDVPSCAAWLSDGEAREVARRLHDVLRRKEEL